LGTGIGTSEDRHSGICVLKGGTLISMEQFSGFYYSEIEALRAKIAEIQVMFTFLNWLLWTDLKNIYVLEMLPCPPPPMIWPCQFII